MTKNEDEGLMYGLDQHIPLRTGKNTIEREFEYFHQNTLNDIFNAPLNQLDNSPIRYASAAVN